MAPRWFKKKPEDTPQKTSQDNDSQAVLAETNKKEMADNENKGRSFFKRLRKGLSKTRQVLTTDIDELFKGKPNIDDDFWEELEELLITSDIGVATAMDLIADLNKISKKIDGPDQLKTVLKDEIISRMQLAEDRATKTASKEYAKPHIIMVVGVNGVGKTTTIGKLAFRHKKAGRKVLLAAGDTFRAAAGEQLTIWAERAGADIVKHKEGADPAAVVFDSIEAALARDMDVVLIDTAGRLHTKINLMEELKKIRRTIAKKIPDGPHEILLVLDATTGQNALAQAELFDKALGVSGLALTKLDGTAKGGIVIAIVSTHKIPLKYIGVGEQVEDLQDFDPTRFVEALF